MSPLPEKPAPSGTLLHPVSAGGICRVFIVQTRNGAEVNQIQQVFRDLGQQCAVRLLSAGTTTAFAVQTTDAVPVLQDVELLLKEHYKFSVVYAGFNPVIHRIVEDLAIETGSRLYPVPSCATCGQPAPFPARLTARGPGRRHARALFCEHCVARATADAGEGARLKGDGGKDTGEAERLYALLVQSERNASAQRCRTGQKRSLFRGGLARRSGRPTPAASEPSVEETRLAS